MNKLDEWRLHAYEIAKRLCREYGKEGRTAFKVSGYIVSILRAGPARILLCLFLDRSRRSYNPLELT